MNRYEQMVRRQMGIPSGGDAGQSFYWQAMDTLRGDVWVSRSANVAKVTR